MLSQFNLVILILLDNVIYLKNFHIIEIIFVKFLQGIKTFKFRRLKSKPP